MAKQIDVLAVMDKAKCVLAAKGVDLLADRLATAADAVAELIKCSDATVKAFEALGRSNGIVDQLETQRNCERALIEQKSANARCRGEA